MHLHPLPPPLFTSNKSKINENDTPLDPLFLYTKKSVEVQTQAAYIGTMHRMDPTPNLIIGALTGRALRASKPIGHRCTRKNRQDINI